MRLDLTIDGMTPRLPGGQDRTAMLAFAYRVKSQTSFSLLMMAAYSAARWKGTRKLGSTYVKAQEFRAYSSQFKVI